MQCGKVQCSRVESSVSDLISRCLSSSPPCPRPGSPWPDMSPIVCTPKCTQFHSIILNSTRLYSTSQNNTVPYCTTLYCIVLQCTVLQCTVLQCTLLHCTLPHCIQLKRIELNWTELYCTVVSRQIYHCHEFQKSIFCVSTTIPSNPFNTPEDLTGCQFVSFCSHP